MTKSLNKYMLMLISIIVIHFVDNKDVYSQSNVETKINISKPDKLILLYKNDTLLVNDNQEKIERVCNYIDENSNLDSSLDDFKGFYFIHIFSKANKSVYKLEIYGDRYRYKGTRFYLHDFRKEFKTIFEYKGDIK